MATPYPSCICGDCSKCRNRERQRKQRRERQLARRMDNAWRTHEPMNLTCPRCGFGKAWLLKEGKLRLHLRCWDCQRGFYVNANPAAKPMKRVFDFDVHEAARFYYGGITSTELAEEIGCTPYTVRRRLTEAGYTLRSQYETRHKSSEFLTQMRVKRQAKDRKRVARLRRQVLRLRAEGLTLPQIAAATKTNIHQVRYAYYRHENGRVLAHAG